MPNSTTRSEESINKDIAGVVSPTDHKLEKSVSSLKKTLLSPDDSAEVQDLLETMQDKQERPKRTLIIGKNRP